MDRLLVTCITLLLLVSSALVAQEATADLSLGKLAKIIYEQPNAVTTPDQIKTGIVLIEKDKTVPVEDAIFFTKGVAKYDLQYRLPHDNVVELYSLLTLRYKGNVDVIHKLKLSEMSVYRDLLDDPKKLADAAASFAEVDNIIQNSEAVARLTQLNELGDSYRNISGNRPDEYREKALKCYNSVIRFNLFYSLYAPSIENLKTQYSHAATEIVALTPKDEVKDLRFFGFAYGEIEKRLDRNKTKLLIKEFPLIHEIHKNVEVWLKSRIDETDPQSDMRKHLDAVMNLLKNPVGGGPW